MTYLLTIPVAIMVYAHKVDLAHDKHIDELTECGYAAVRGEI